MYLCDCNVTTTLKILASYELDEVRKVITGTE
jgi:hypothetical protein